MTQWSEISSRGTRTQVSCMSCMLHRRKRYHFHHCGDFACSTGDSSSTYTTLAIFHGPHAKALPPTSLWRLCMLHRQKPYNLHHCGDFACSTVDSATTYTTVAILHAPQAKALPPTPLWRLCMLHRQKPSNLHHCGDFAPLWRLYTTVATLHHCGDFTPWHIHHKMSFTWLQLLVCKTCWPTLCRAQSSTIWRCVATNIHASVQLQYMWWLTRIFGRTCWSTFTLIDYFVIAINS